MLPDGAVIADAAQTIVFVNAQLAQLIGYPPAELVGQKIDVLVPGPARARLSSLVSDFYDNGETARLMFANQTLPLLRRDGSALAVEVVMARVTMDGRRMTLALIRDTTTRLQLVAERERLLETLELNPDSVIVVDLTTMRIEYVNEAATVLTGYSREELVGAQTALLTPGLDQRLRAEMGTELTRDGATRYADIRMRAKDGSEVPMEVRLRLVSTSDGSHYLLSVARDLRPRKEQDELLRVSEESFRTAFQHAPIGVCVADISPDGSASIRMANQALADMLGTAVAELTGRALSDYAAGNEGDELAALFRDLVSGERPEITTLTRFQRADGSTVWAEYHTRMFALPGDTGPLALGHVVDVTGFVTQQSRLTRTARLQASISEVTTAALVGEPTPELLQRIVTGAASTLDGEGAALVLGVPGSDRLRLEAVHGEVLGSVSTGVVFGSLQDVVDQLKDGTLLLAEPPPAMPEPLASALGPGAVSRFEHVDGQPGGYLTVVRRRGGQEFTPRDAHDLQLLAEQTRLALQLSWARRDQQRLALIEDRQRIARDLHDVVIQDLIALGMELVTAAEKTPEDADRQHRLDQVTRLEAAVRQLRRVVFELRVPERQEPSQAIRNLAVDAGRVMGHVPHVTLIGPVDSLPDDVAHDVMGVLREALSNVARHATASNTTVHVTVDDVQVTLLVEDDGHGMPATPRLGHGIPNIRQRATARQGRAEVSSSALGGARLLWSCRLPGSGTKVTGSEGPSQAGSP